MFIVAGSHPVMRAGSGYKVVHLFSPSGEVYMQDKLHSSPSERQTWGIKPGRGLKIFDAPFGKFGVLCCYSIADLDFGTLAHFREIGSVQPLHDLRLDLVELSVKEKVERVRVE